MGKISSASRIFQLEYAAVILGSNATILADTAMDQTNPTVVTVFAAQPDVPRNVTVKGNDANVTGNVVITGLDALGGTITETLALNAANLVTGSKAFASIVSIQLPDWNVANTERVRVGVGAKLGLTTLLERNSVLAAFLAGVKEAVAPTVAFSTVAVSLNTVTLNSALNGSAVAVDYYETL